MADIKIDPNGVITFDEIVVVDLRTEIPQLENDTFSTLYATLLWCNQLQDKVKKIESFDWAERIGKDKNNQSLIEQKEKLLRLVRHLIALKILAGDDENSQWNKALMSLDRSICDEFDLSDGIRKTLQD